MKTHVFMQNFKTIGCSFQSYYRKTKILILDLDQNFKHIFAYNFRFKIERTSQKLLKFLKSLETSAPPVS